MARVLVVEDQRDLALALAEHLEARGHESLVAGTARAAEAAVRGAHPDLILLDLMLPDRPGDHVLRTVRRQGYDGPVLILSALGHETSKLRSFRLGADDYVTKPFSILVLLARIESLLRRVPPRPENVIRLDGGRIELWPGARRIMVEGAEVHLRPREFDLLLALTRRRGRAVSREVLLTDVWRYARASLTRTVDVHIGGLRRKIEVEPANPRLITTVRGVGYRLSGPP